MAQVIELNPEAETSEIDHANELIKANEIDRAYTVLEKVLMHEPMNAPALVLMSVVMKKAGKIALAYPLAKLASQLRPDRYETWNGLGHAGQLLWKLDEGEANYRKALKYVRGPVQRGQVLNNLCSVYLDRGKFADAEPLARESLALDDDPMTRHNLALALLGQRKWKEGWPYYTSSVGTQNRLRVKYRNPGEPDWDGTKGKTIVVYGEQGLGDEICAASMVPDAAKDCKKLILDCDKRLEKLFRRSFPQASVFGTRWEKSIHWPGVEQSEIAASCAGFELGKFYRNSDADFPGTPYLTPCPDRTAMWKGLWAQKRKPVIGIAWTGGNWHNGSMNRNLPLAEWKPIFSAIDAHWVSLQYRDASQEIQGTPVVQHPFATLTKDYDDTAALVASCDLVIGMQTSVNHLAGALGVPCWIILPSTSQWRYGEEYDTLPWYQSVRIFRQIKNRWPVHDIANELQSRFS